MFLAPWFALAALAAAAGPVVIHLLNRRRFRTVPWAAMDFLREALRRSQRLLRIRDILLLILRTACIILFGLAMARPYLSRATAAISANEPVHGVVLVDNSLSMSYQELDGPLLDAAKLKARQWIERQPSGSRFSIVPLCGPSLSLEPYPSRDDALDTLGRVETLDRAASAAEAIGLAAQACRHAPELPAKRIVLIGDAQTTARPPESLGPQLARLGVPVQTIRVSPREAENAWVGRFELQDRVADPATPAVFLATVHYQGRQTRRDVQVTLSVEGAAVASVTVDLVPGQVREVRFPPYYFQVAPEPGRPALVRASVSIAPDRLPLDDRRFLVVPVVAALPVVFVDQFGPGESARRSRYGETYHLRRLLAPRTGSEDSSRQLIQVRHVTIDQLTAPLLADARLVVVAGVADPRPGVDLLRQYVVQGGRLIVAAGGQFDPAAWNQSAWLDGLGILPAPLRGFVGRLPDEPGARLQAFQINFQSLVHDWFLLEQVPAEELEDLFGLPYFFKAAAIDVSGTWSEPMLRRVSAQIETDRKRLAEIDAELGRLSSDDANPRRERLLRERAAVEPAWLVWRPEATAEPSPPAAEELAERSRPQVLAKLTDGTPLFVQRRIGRGQVLWFAGGFSSSWSTLALTNTMLLWDRIGRDLLESSFARRNLGTTQPVSLPVAAADRSARIVFADADGRSQTLSPGAVGSDRYAVATANPARRGLYEVAAYAGASGGREAKLWSVPLAVNGPAEESEIVVAGNALTAGLSPAARASGEEGPEESLWVADRSENAQAASAAGQSLWRWFMGAALVCLLLELGVLAMPMFGKEARR